MPLYDFKCSICGLVHKDHLIYHARSMPDSIRCHKCDGPALRQPTVPGSVTKFNQDPADPRAGRGKARR